MKRSEATTMRVSFSCVSARTTRRAALLGLLCVAACAGGAKPSSSSAKLGSGSAAHEKGGLVLPARPDLRRREDLPAEVREMLTARMARHGVQMTDLMLCVVMLEYDLAARLASKLADEPKLGRPAAGEQGTLNAMLPPGFFVYQDALADSARALAIAASTRDDPRLLISFADVTKSCVGCHSAYRQADFAAFEHDEPGDPLPCDAGDEACEEDEGAEDTTSHTHL